MAYRTVTNIFDFGDDEPELRAITGWLYDQGFIAKRRH